MPPTSKKYPYCHPPMSGGQAGHLIQVRSNKMLQGKKNYARLMFVTTFHYLQGQLIRIVSECKVLTSVHILFCTHIINVSTQIRTASIIFSLNIDKT